MAPSFLESWVIPLASLLQVRQGNRFGPTMHQIQFLQWTTWSNRKACMLDNFCIAFAVNLLVEVLVFLILRRKERKNNDRKVPLVPRMSDASKSTSTSDALKSSSGSELKCYDILYALLSGPKKVQIVNQMEERIFLYELQIKQ
jgi:hypothetical protein